MNSCSGPCLQHCYSKSKLKYILIGIFIGLVISYLFKKNKKDRKNKKDKKNKKNKKDKKIKSSNEYYGLSNKIFKI
jgi:hypothetical protein